MKARTRDLRPFPRWHLFYKEIRNQIDPDIKLFYKKTETNYKVAVFIFMKLTGLGASRCAFSLAHHEVLLVLG